MLGHLRANNKGSGNSRFQLMTHAAQCFLNAAASHCCASQSLVAKQPLQVRPVSVRLMLANDSSASTRTMCRLAAYVHFHRHCQCLPCSPPHILANLTLCALMMLMKQQPHKHYCCLRPAYGGLKRPTGGGWGDPSLLTPPRWPPASRRRSNLLNDVLSWALAQDSKTMCTPSTASPAALWLYCCILLGLW